MLCPIAKIRWYLAKITKCETIYIKGGKPTFCENADNQVKPKQSDPSQARKALKWAQGGFV